MTSIHGFQVVKECDFVFNLKNQMYYCYNWRRQTTADSFIIVAFSCDFHFTIFGRRKFTALVIRLSDNIATALVAVTSANVGWENVTRFYLIQST